MSKYISIVTPCYNEEGNVEELYRQVSALFKELEGYSYEHIFIDNDSKDGTVAVLKRLAALDKKVKIIVNSRNFGHIRSPYYGLLQARGDAVILLVADLQDPPELVKDFIRKWEEGFKIVLGVKSASKENFVMYFIRSIYYRLVSNLSEIEIIKHYTGFGLYDKEVIEIIRKIDDCYPFFRGIISEIGFEKAKIEYTQPKRNRGITSNNFYRLYDIGMLGIMNNSKFPLRIATFLGFIMSGISLAIACMYLVLKITLWSQYPVGTASIAIGIFFMASIQLFFIGIIGEYIGAIYTQVLKRPLVIEKERINFD